MAIQLRGNKYSIRYVWKKPDGTREFVRISNDDWTSDVGKRYMQRIEAEEIARDKFNRSKYGSSVKKGSVQVVANEYITSLKGKNKASTVSNKEGIMKYIVGKIGNDTPIDKAFTPDLLSNFRALVTDGELKGFSSVRRNKYLEAYREFADYCALSEYIGENLCNRAKRLLSPVRKETVDASEQSTGSLRCWTKDEWERFIATFTEDDPWRIYFETVYWAALRIGESIPLLGSDFNYQRKTISISKSMDNSGVVTTPKTSCSIRKVDLPTFLVEKIEKYIKTARIMPGDYLFFPMGRTSKTTVRRIMKEHIKRSGVSVIPPHGLRHSCATRLLLAKDAKGQPIYDITYVSHHLGHSSIAETMKVYINYIPNAYKGIMDKA